MILILSNHLDLSTQNVCKWLKYEGTDFYYLGIEYFFKVFKGELGDSAVNECLLNIKNAKVIWNRKWVYGVLDASIRDDFKNNVALSEFKAYCNHLFWTLRDRIWVDRMENIGVDKLTQLEIANSLGLITLPYILCTQKENLQQFLDNNDIVICKSLGTTVSVNENGESKTTFTNTITRNNINTLPNHFGLSFFQQFCDKSFDVKVVVLGEKFFPIGINSQENVKTKVDFRRYDWDNPNRLFSIRLPPDISSGIIKLMKSLNLKYGVVDFVVSKKNEYYFLEVNPIGQFSYLSSYSSFNIEKEFAVFLTSLL